MIQIITLMALTTIAVIFDYTTNIAIFSSAMFICMSLYDLKTNINYYKRFHKSKEQQDQEKAEDLKRSKIIWNIKKKN